MASSSPLATLIFESYMHTHKKPPTHAYTHIQKVFQDRDLKSVFLNKYKQTHILMHMHSHAYMHTHVLTKPQSTE